MRWLWVTVEPRPWDRLQDTLPPLSTYEFEALSKSIAKHGVLQKILMLPDGRIIDGCHRWKITNGKAPRRVLNIPESEAFMLGIVLNLGRRNMSPEQLKQLRDGLRKDREGLKKLALNLRMAHKSQAEVARIIKVARQTISDWQRNASNAELGNACIPDCRVSIPKSEYESIYNRVMSGETQESVAGWYKATRQRISQIVKLVKARRHKPKVAEGQPFPSKKFRCLIIDPPWPVKKIEREKRPNQGIALDYPTLSLKEIAKLPVPKLANPAGCHVYLWVTHKFLPEGLRLFEKWGVKYQCVLTWIKSTGMTPFSWMYNTEHVLFGRIGNLDLLRYGVKLSFGGKKREHSRKPESFYDIVRIVSPRPRMDLFAREKRKGFDAWGDEVKKFGGSR